MQSLTPDLRVGSLRAAIAFIALVSLFAPSMLLAGVCGDNSPAVPVPQCRNASTGAEVDCSSAGAVEIWPDGFRPGLPGQTLPSNRDTTDRTGGQTVPGASSGHELFAAVDVVGDVLFVSYNAGIQAWDIGPGNEENPPRIAFRDGWQGAFFSFPPPSEQLIFIEEIDAIADGQDMFLAVSGKAPVGPSLWRFSTGSNTFTQLYQDTDAVSNQQPTVQQIRVARASNNRVYAFAASNNGLNVYDVTRAETLAPCWDDNAIAGRQCSSVYLGVIGDSNDSVDEFVRYLDVIVKDQKIYVAVSDNSGFVSFPRTVEIWEFNPSIPGNSIRRFAGAGLSSAIAGISLFEHDGAEYMALIESDVLKIFDVTSCLDSNGCSSLTSAASPIALSSFPAPDQFLTFSESNGTPFLYYGINSNALEGPAIEQLYDLSELGTSNPSLPEITSTGGSYVDPCNGQMIDYWGDYYSRNEHGLRELEPRIGKFSGNYFYRAADTVLDVHVRTTGSSTPIMTTSVSDPAPHWFGDPVDFAATAQNCTGTNLWSWFTDDTFTPVVVGNDDTVSITFDDCGTEDCPSRVVDVWGVKDVCSGDPNLVINEATVTVQEPRAYIRSVDVSPIGDPPGEYPLCTVLSFDPTVDGRTPIGYSWTIRDEAGMPVDPGSSTTSEILTWDTSGVPLGPPPPEIFADGFESGNFVEWDGVVGGGLPSNRQNHETPVPVDLRELVARGGGSATFDVELTVTNEGGTHQDVLMPPSEITLTSLGELAFVGDPPITATDLGGGAFDFSVGTDNATEWRWEFEDPENGTSTGCQFFASCQVYDWGEADDTAFFQWTPPNVPGVYSVVVSIRNCEQVDNPLSTDPVPFNVDEIDSPEPPVVTDFRVSTDSYPICGGASCAIGNCDCPVNQSIEFTAAGDGNVTSFEVEWDDGTSMSFPVGSTITHTYTATGLKFPEVRARAGSQLSDPYDLEQSLNIVP